MIKQTLWRIACVSSLLLAASPLSAQDAGPGFEYGGTCAALYQIHHREILSLVHSVHADNFGSFCTPEGIYSCDDYSALFSGAGRLEENGGSGCRFVPAQDE